MEANILRQERRESKQEQLQAWQLARIEGKKDRRDLTDQIKRLVEWADSEGSKNGQRYYTTFSKMVYSIAFGLKKIPKDFRNTLDEKTLRHLQMIEWKVSQWLDDAITRGGDYHAPYHDIKERMGMLIEIIGTIRMSENQLQLQ